MDTADTTRQYFLIGTIILAVLIIGGLIWAVSLGPGEGGGNTDPNIVFNDEGDPQIGNPDAKVTVRMYSDFQCPACKLAEEPLRQIIEQYKDRVNFYWNDFPITSLHRNAVPAAVAARCAQEQGKFWEYSQSIFQNQEQWANLNPASDFFVSLAEQVGLQADAFATCLSSNEPRQKVQNDLTEATNLRLDSTPTFFINRKIRTGALSVSQWSTLLDAELQ